MKIILQLICLFFFSIQSRSQTAEFRQVKKDDVRIMMEEYDGAFKNHKKTDGLIISADKLIKILERFKGQDITIVYARYLKSAEMNKKTTLLLIVGAKSASQEYYDLGGEGALCPLPENCGVEN